MSEPCPNHVRISLARLSAALLAQPSPSLRSPWPWILATAMPLAGMDDTAQQSLIDKLDQRLAKRKEQQAREEEKAAANAARSRDELAQMAKANAAEAEKNAKLTKAMAAAKFAAAHKHQQHKDEKGRLVAQVDAAKTAADAERAAAKQVSLF